LISGFQLRFFPPSPFFILEFLSPPKWGRMGWGAFSPPARLLRKEKKTPIKVDRGQPKMQWLIKHDFFCVAFRGNFSRPSQEETGKTLGIGWEFYVCVCVYAKVLVQSVA
jgi:hypothetical protein